MKLSEDQIEQIREATNIVDLVSEHVQLKKRGRNYLGLCPFHNEKTPSFNVLEEKGIFKCFGCGKGGDVFSFVMELEGLTFPEALKRLANKANIDVEPAKSAQEQEAQSLRESIYATIKAAATWYFRTLRDKPGAEAMTYLRKRGMEPEVMRRFGLGYAPDEPGAFIKAMNAAGFSTKVLDAAGLVAKGNSGEWYERFRGRVIFPVFAATGRVVGFGGRIMPNAGKDIAKYINSPDTSVYHKSQILYGLYQAKDMIRKKNFAILVEGYADVLSVFQAGFQNVVAASGTSLTVDQLNLLRRYTTSVVLLFDADQAGKNAAVRGIELAIQAGFDVNTVVLPAGEDPDSFIKQKGAAAFQAALDRQQSFVETKAQWFEEQGAFKDPGQMSAAVRSIVETIAKMPDAIKQAVFVRRLGERFHISEQMLLTELDAMKSRDQRSANSPAANARREREEKAIDNPDRTMKIMVTQPVPKPEAAILEAMLLDPRGVHNLFNDTSFNMDLLTNRIVREIVSYLMQEVEENKNPNVGELLADFRGKPEYQQVLVESAISPTTFSEHWGENEASDESKAVEQARHAAATLMRHEIRRMLSDVRYQLDRSTQPEEVHELMRQSLLLAQRLEVLKDFSIADDSETPRDKE